MKVIIDECKRIEKYKRAMPVLEDMAKQGNFGCYCAGSLIIGKEALGLGEDDSIQSYDVEPLNGTGSEILARGQYLISKIFITHKEKTCHSYEQALANVKEYEGVFDAA